MSLPPMWCVVVLRGPMLDPLTRMSLTRGEAEQKAQSLSFVYLTDPEKQWIVPEARVIIIDASEYFEKK